MHIEIRPCKAARGHRLILCSMLQAARTSFSPIHILYFFRDSESLSWSLSAKVELRSLERIKECDMEGVAEAEERIAFMTEATDNMQAHFRDEVYLALLVD